MAKRSLLSRCPFYHVPEHGSFTAYKDCMRRNTTKRKPYGLRQATTAFSTYFILH